MCVCVCVCEMRESEKEQENVKISYFCQNVVSRMLLLLTLETLICLHLVEFGAGKPNDATVVQMQHESPISNGSHQQGPIPVHLKEAFEEQVWYVVDKSMPRLILFSSVIHLIVSNSIAAGRKRQCFFNDLAYSFSPHLYFRRVTTCTVCFISMATMGRCLMEV